MIQVNLADGRQLNFPVGTDQNVIQATVKKLIAEQQPQQIQQPQEDFIPTEESLDKPSQPQEQKGVLETIGGGAEAALAMGSSMVAEPIAGLAGIGAALNPLETQGAGARRVAEVREALTYKPRLKGAQAAIQTVGETIQPVAEELQEFEQKLGDQTFAATGSPALAAGATALPTALMEILGVAGVKGATRKSLHTPKSKRQLIADEIKKGNPDIDTVTKALDESGNLVTSKPAQKALKALGGDLKAKQTISVLERANPATKAQARKMLDIIEQGRKEPLFGQANRPSDILGDSVANRAKAIVGLNKKASKRIGNIANSLSDTKVNMQQQANNFRSSMENLGVTFKVGEDGWIKPDLSRSTFSGGNQRQLEVLVNKLAKKELPFNEAHKLKQQIRDNFIDFDKGGAGQMSRESEGIMKELSSSINNSLGAKSSKYKKANQDFAKTVDLKEQFNKLAGKDIDLFSDAAPKALGGKARRLVSNAESRNLIQQTLSNTDDVLKGFGVRFMDDIPSLNFTVTQLENLFKIEPPASLQGRMQRAGANMAQGQSATTTAITEGLGALKSLKQADFDEIMAALKALTKEGKSK